MKNTFQQLLNELNACLNAKEWAEDKTIEQVVEQCHRGDWLLWLAKKVDIGLQPLTLAKGHCANTVRHLMRDTRSTHAVDTAIAFGEGRVARKYLDAAHTDAYAAYSEIAYSADYRGARAAAAAARASTTCEAWTVAKAAADASSPGLRKENLLKTADICREHIGSLLIEKVNQLLQSN
jgi:hypothetical protein